MSYSEREIVFKKSADDGGAGGFATVSQYICLIYSQ